MKLSISGVPGVIFNIFLNLFRQAFIEQIMQSFARFSARELAFFCMINCSSINFELTNVISNCITNWKFLKMISRPRRGLIIVMMCFISMR